MSILGADLAIGEVLLKRLVGLSGSLCAIVMVGRLTSIVATVLA